MDKYYYFTKITDNDLESVPTIYIYKRKEGSIGKESEKFVTRISIPASTIEDCHKRKSESIREAEFIVNACNQAHESTKEQT